LVIAKPVDTGNDSQNLFLGATRSYHFTIANVNTTDRSQSVILKLIINKYLYARFKIITQN